MVEAMRHAINSYIEENGIGHIVTRQELSRMINEIMTVESNSFLPADYCYNRTNKGIYFESNVHLFEMLDDGRYKILGENYLYSGLVLGRKENGQGYEIKGVWSEGKYEAGVSDIYLRLVDLYESLIQVLKGARIQMINTSVTVSQSGNNVCTVLVMDEVYKISTNISGWKEETTYLCAEESNTIVYYVETIDECLGEIKRLVDFVNVYDGTVHTSELSKVITASTFEKVYRVFVEQADKNAISKKAQGTKVPFGFSEKPKCDGAYFNAQYGQGTASMTPYMNWWVVSIYYLPDSENIIIGIEEDRYPHLKEMTIKPSRYMQIGNKKMNIAVFYSTTKDRINYSELYQNFIDVCEEVMRLGLH